MFFTIYKKLPNDQLCLVRYELVNNKWRKWRGTERSLGKYFEWKEYSSNNSHTGKARASLAMFKDMNSLIERGYSIYKKKSKKLKVIRPLIRIRKFNWNAIKKFYGEGNKLYFTCYHGVLAIRRADGRVYNNQTRKKIKCAHQTAAKQQLGYIANYRFIPFPWNIEGSPAELKMWLDFNKNKNLKTLVKINDIYYQA